MSNFVRFYEQYISQLKKECLILFNKNIILLNIIYNLCPLIEI